MSEAHPQREFKADNLLNARLKVGTLNGTEEGVNKVRPHTEMKLQLKAGILSHLPNARIKVGVLMDEATEEVVNNTDLEAHNKLPHLLNARLEAGVLKDKTTEGALNYTESQTGPDAQMAADILSHLLNAHLKACVLKDEATEEGVNNIELEAHKLPHWLVKAQGDKEVTKVCVLVSLGWSLRGRRRCVCLCVWERGSL